MRTRVFALAVVMWTASAAWSVPLAAGPQTPVAPALAAAHTNTEYGAVVTKYCVTCHNDRAKVGGLTLDKLDVSNAGASPDVWERVALMSLSMCTRLPEVTLLSLGGGFKVGRMPGEATTDLQKIGLPVMEAFRSFHAKHEQVTEARFRQ